MYTSFELLLVCHQLWRNPIYTTSILQTPILTSPFVQQINFFTTSPCTIPLLTTPDLNNFQFLQYHTLQLHKYTITTLQKKKKILHLVGVPSTLAWDKLWYHSRGLTQPSVWVGFQVYAFNRNSTLRKRWGALATQ